MDTAPVTVTQALILELIDGTGAATPLSAELGYDSRDPYAMTACFNTLDGRVRWVFARELVARGMFEPTGDGDVQVWPCLDNRGRAVTMIELSSPDGEAIMQARTEEVVDFLSRTEALVPLGQEGDLLDVDRAIHRLMS